MGQVHGSSVLARARTDHERGSEILSEGYTTTADHPDGEDYWWICEPCFLDFRERFDWQVVELSSPLAPALSNDARAHATLRKKMRLTDGHGNAVALWITGYQFPDAVDPRQRFSWHMVSGEASCGDGSWSFSGPVLTCDETPDVSRWLRVVADWVSDDRSRLNPTALPPELTFTEPNLALRVGDAASEAVTIHVDLDYEFTPPWDRHAYAGDPFRVSVRAEAEQLRRAADEWDAEAAPYPDRDAPSES